MPDYSPLVELIQGIAERAVAACKPANVIFGTVRAASPLSVVTEQKLPLGQAQLILAGNVTGLNGLKAGEKVVMLREQGAALCHFG